MGKVNLSNITETNNLIYCGAALVTEVLGINRNGKKNRQEPWWKRRLEGQVRDLNRDLGRVNALIEKKAVKKKESDELQRKYRLKQKGLQIVKEELKQRIKAKSGKITRYNQRIKQYQQNRQFKNNEAGFYKRLNNEGIQAESEAPERSQAKQYWTDLWSTDVIHNRKAKWLEDFKMKMNGGRGQGEVNVTREKILKILERVPNWKAPGPDGVQGFWLKNFKSMHQYLEKYFAECLEGQTPTWMTKGRTVLIQKDKSKGRDASNYRPITCLPLCWKLLTALLSDEIYSFLEENQILPEEQKGCRRKSRGTGDQLYIDKMILREVKVRKKNIAMGWIDYRKAFDMVPHSWILECLSILGVNHTVVAFLEKTMKDWRVDLTCANVHLGEVNIKRGIFQGDALSPLLFVITLIPLTSVLKTTKHGYEFAKNGEKINHLLYMDDLKLYAKNEKELDSLVQTVKVFSKDIGMDFGVEKSAMLVMKRGKKTTSDGIKLPDNIVIKSLKEGEGYKYLGILQIDEVQEKETKRNVSNEYKRRVRKILETKLNGGNIIKGINSWAIPVLRYSAAFINWTKTELQWMDRRTRKLLTMHNGLHPRSNVDRAYISRKEGGRGLLCAEDTINLAKIGLERYVKESKERLIIAARGDNENTEIDTGKEFKKRTRLERKTKWKEKTLHGQFLRQTEELADKDQWSWLTDGTLKRETESLIMAAQEQALRTNLVKAKIDKSQEDSKCRMCGKADESISHLLSECSKLSQKEYKRRHDWMGKKIHWEVCRKYGLEAKAKWYEHEPQAVCENEEYKILWDFSIQTDHVIEARRPDMIIVEKKSNKCQIIDFAVPYDTRVDEKEKEKIQKYQDLARELKKLWNKNVKVIPVIVGALGTTPSRLSKRLKEIGINTKIVELQKAVLLHSARILRKVLEI